MWQIIVAFCTRLKDRVPEANFKRKSSKNWRFARDKRAKRPKVELAKPDGESLGPSHSQIKKVSSEEWRLSSPVLKSS